MPFHNREGFSLRLGLEFGMPYLDPAAAERICSQPLLDFVLGSSAAALTEDGVNGDAVEAVLKFVQQVGSYYGMENYKGLLSNGVISSGSEGQSVSYGDGSYRAYQRFEKLGTPAGFEDEEPTAQCRSSSGVCRWEIRPLYPSARWLYRHR